MPIPIYLCAATCTIVVAIISDKIKHRFAFVLLGAIPSVAGYIIMLNMHSVSPITIGWLTNNLGGHYKRSVGIAMQISLANCGGLVASNVVVNSEAPEYPLGFGVGLGFMLLAIFSSIAFLFYLRAENRRRDVGKRDSLLDLPAEELRNLGDDHPSFRYTY
ncbi:uncharacterized protein A1O9_02036 [Exophiala aquamarina CBS 119918]|uniref:Major facilitator superfamily (MFS) profile domain-containing protein n=1 Tax=Exophiala aquamarina CBS 119918 TaxID=1182545 RepID=A0A072PXZ5_9EURO|nr:uncharacterized protein A1O9_02036 [Exophiala aquamarina CBS 119918]KEF60475.1 hypothetical protein A1O9_02036 [Exophiala aquamarina CBS 119918]